MSSAPNGERRFRLGFSGVIAEAIRQLQRQASREGWGAHFLQALRKIVERLRSSPSDLGEPLYRLPALRMEVRCVVLRPIYIDFAVCEDRPLVLIKAVKLLSKQE
jgi:hypothetical protein